MSLGMSYSYQSEEIDKEPTLSRYQLWCALNPHISSVCNNVLALFAKMLHYNLKEEVESCSMQDERSICHPRRRFLLPHASLLFEIPMHFSEKFALTQTDYGLLSVCDG